jgi:hypothetical protein
MSEAIVDATVTRTLIVLPGATWRAELEAELIRLGITEDRAPISAGRVLSRICKHAGYLNCFIRDEPEPEPVKDQPESRGRKPKANAGAAGKEA